MLESPAVSQCQESFVTSAAVGGADSLTAYSLSVSNCQKNDDYNHICGVIQNYLARHSKSSVADCQIQNEICKWNKCTAADVVATSHQSDSPFVTFLRQQQRASRTHIHFEHQYDKWTGRPKSLSRWALRGCHSYRDVELQQGT